MNNYEKWLELKEKEDIKYLICQSIGLASMVITIFIACGKYQRVWHEGLIFGTLPYFVFYCIAKEYDEKSNEYQRKYNNHIPYIAIRKVNALLSKLEITEDTEEVEITYVMPNGMEKLTVNRKTLKIKQSDSDCDYIKYQLDINNDTKESKLVFANIYLTPETLSKAQKLDMFEAPA